MDRVNTKCRCGKVESLDFISTKGFMRLFFDVSRGLYKLSLNVGPCLGSERKIFMVSGNYRHNHCTDTMPFVISWSCGYTSRAESIVKVSLLCCKRAVSANLTDCSEFYITRTLKSFPKETLIGYEYYIYIFPR